MNVNSRPKAVPGWVRDTVSARSSEHEQYRSLKRFVRIGSIRPILVGINDCGNVRFVGEDVTLLLVICLISGVHTGQLTSAFSNGILVSRVVRFRRESNHFLSIMRESSVTLSGQSFWARVYLSTAGRDEEVVPEYIPPVLPEDIYQG